MLILALFACGSASDVPLATAAAGDPGTVILPGYAHVRQKPDFCGEACLAMAMAGRGSPIDQDAAFDVSGLDPAEGRGAYTKELVVAARALGFDPGPTWYPVAAGDPAALDQAFAAMVTDLRAGVPSIVCTHFDERRARPCESHRRSRAFAASCRRGRKPRRNGSFAGDVRRPDTTEHFRLVTGYDAATDEVVYQDPALDDGADLRMTKARFLRLWPLHYTDETDTLVRLRLAGTPTAPAVSTGPTAADLAQAVMAARAKIGDEPGFTIRVQAPWVVVGDLPEAAIDARATGTVAWTTDQLRKDYFAKDPADTWTIWLFKDDASYTRHAKAYFGDEPDTPYGYADSEELALIMNIGTGGGTLVHEMVHPFIGANLPGCPSWINEGLASLYEHVGEEDGHIWGYTNWRLRGLKAGIQSDTLPSLRWLTGAGWNDFYNDDRGVNYAMSRYLMQYLQEKGKLRAFMAAYATNRATDPTGYQTLLDTLGVRDVPAFTEEWKRWALAL